jgi:hypothetical protein
MPIMSSLSGLTPTEQIVTNGLVLNLDAGNSSSYSGTGTTWTDLSGNSNNGTLTNGPTYSSDNRGFFNFNGTSQYVNLGNKFNISPGTAALWFTVNNNITTTNTFNYRLFGKTTNYELRFTNTTSDAGNFGALQADIGGNVTTSQRNWTANQWYYATLTWNQTSNVSNIYVNGVLDGTGTVSNITGQTTGNFEIGRSGTQGYLAGKISLFKLYNRVISAEEVSQNFNALRGRYGI